MRPLGAGRSRQASIVDRSAKPRRHRPDYGLVVISLVLMVIGLIVIYAISPGLAAIENVGENYYVSKQIIAILLGLITFGIVSFVPLERWKHMQKPLLVAAIVSAGAVQLFGEEVNGAYRWVQIGGISFQAAELIKFALLVWLAGLLADKLRDRKLDDVEATFKPLGIVLLAIGFVIAFMQSDLGSAAVMVAIMFAMAFVAGLPLRRIAVFSGAIALGVILLISISPYRRDRVFTYLNPERDCSAAGYQSCQALIAVGSGGLFGTGLANSGQAYGYLPEAANDSIFAIFAEKFGFVGVAILLSLFIALFGRLKSIMERAPDTYTRLLAAGVLAWLSTQSIINIGAMIGLLPLKGITLPLVSYGGTSVVFVAAAVGLVFNISRYTTYGVNTLNSEGSAYENRTDGRRDRRAYYAPLSRR